MGQTRIKYQICGINNSYFISWNYSWGFIELTSSMYVLYLL